MSSEPSTATAVDVAALDDLKPGGTLRVEIDDVPICLVRVFDGNVLAVHDVCTHAEASLSEGWVEGATIECPKHGAAFALSDGEALTPPATLPVPTFPVEVREGRIWVLPEPSHPHPLRDR